MRADDTADLVLMRASEMYLIEAEAKVRDGVALNQAVIPLNTLRNARGVGDYDVTGKSQEDVLNEILMEATAMQQPPSDKGKRLKIYYMTQVAVKPPSFVIFVNDKELMHFSYQRYLENKIRESFGFKGTSLKFFVRERKERDN